MISKSSEVSIVTKNSEIMKYGHILEILCQRNIKAQLYTRSAFLYIEKTDKVDLWASFKKTEILRVINIRRISSYGA